MGVGRVAVDHVAGQDLHVTGHVQRRGVLEDRLQIAEIGGIDHAAALLSTLAENLDHVGAADRAVGVQALGQRGQGRLSQAEGIRLDDRHAAVAVNEPAFA